MNENARVMYTMEWNNQHKMISKRSLADVIGEMSTNAVKAREEAKVPATPSQSLKSDDDTLQQEIRNFISELEKLKVRQAAVEG